MLKIEIISGTYGYLNEKGIIERKTAGSAAFLVSEKETERLVKLGVARIIDDSQYSEDIDNEIEDNGIDANDNRYSPDMSFKDLQAFAKNNSVSGYESAKNKTALLKYLDGYFENISKELNDSEDSNNSDEEEPPVINPSGVDDEV